MEDRSREGDESCSVDGCTGSLGGSVGGVGFSNITAEYFVDLKRDFHSLVLLCQP